jgi:hypothetical protein
MRKAFRLETVGGFGKVMRKFVVEFVVKLLGAEDVAAAAVPGYSTLPFTSTEARALRRALNVPSSHARRQVVFHRAR